MAVGVVWLLVALAAGSVRGWTPTGPWVEPTAPCMRNYIDSLRSTLNTHRKGCRADVPQDAVPQGVSVLTASQCVNTCFGFYFNNGLQPLGTLNVTALWTSEAECYCREEVTEIDSAAKDCSGDVIVYQLPTGCLFESRDACAAAPADGCILTLDNCCIDASGDVWPGFHNLVPWWAWGVGAVVLLSCSLLGLVRRTMTRYGGGYDPLPQTAEEFDEETVERLKEEYSVLLKQLVEDDKRFQKARQLRDAPPEPPSAEDNDGGETPVPNPASTSLHSDPESLVGTGAAIDLDHDYGQGGTCPICLDELDPVQCVRLKCGHRMRLTCMQQYVMHSISRGKVPACPICRAKVLTPSREQVEAAT